MTPDYKKERGRNDMSKEKDPRTFRVKQKIFYPVCECYRLSEKRLLLASENHYSYASELQKKNDYEFLKMVNTGLMLCSSEDAECLRMCYLYPESRDLYASMRSRSSFYRICRHAIDEIVHCLGI